MAPSVRSALRDILEAIAKIERYAADADPDLVQLGRLHFEAILYNVLVITEASRQIPEEAKGRRTDIPWRDIATTGNNIRHRYFRIDRKIIAEIVRHDLPALGQAASDIWRDLGYGDLPTFD